MRTITENPIDVIPQIMERDITENAVIIHMQNNDGDQWLYLAGFSIDIPGNLCWIGGNIHDNGKVQEFLSEHNFKSLISLILTTYKLYDVFEPFIWIAESISEVKSILNDITSMNPVFRKEFLDECSYMEI